MTYRHRKMTDELRQQILAAVEKCEHGWCTPEKALAMADVICAERPQVVVEIGVFAGRSLIPQALAMREASPLGVVYGIDAWNAESALEGESNAENIEWWRNKVDLAEIHRYCMQQIWRQKLIDRVVILQCPSQVCAHLFRNKEIGLLHIDGSHSEVASCRDVDLYVPAVRSDGYVFFDDCDWGTTQKALKLLEKTCTQTGTVGNCAIWKKRNPFNEPKNANWVARMHRDEHGNPVKAHEHANA